MTLVDAHHHLWRADQGYTWLDEPALAPIRRTFTAEDLAAAVAGSGVTRTVLVEGGALEGWRGHLAALAAHPNVTAKLSGLVTEADWRAWTVGDLRPYVAAAVDAFGPERLMFGSDWPVCLLAAPSYGRVTEALAEALPPLSPAERAQVFGGTAVRTYDLHP